jgi:hypothetical protein
MQIGRKRKQRDEQDTELNLTWRRLYNTHERKDYSRLEREDDNCKVLYPINFIVRSHVNIDWYLQAHAPPET